MESTLLEHPRSPNFMDTPFTYDSMSDLEPYLQYPQSPYGVSMPLPGPSSSSPRLDFNSLNLANSMGEYSYSSSGSYTTASPGRSYMPPDNSISPPALYSLSGGKLSSDGLTSGRRSRGSGTHSPASVHNVPYAASASRRKSRNDDSDDEDDAFQPVIPNNASTDMRRETIRRQRIESEQRRRDELRNGYRRLKDALPVSNQKSSKMTAQQLQTRLQQAENEVQRLCTVNEALMLGTAEQRHAAVAAAVAAVSQQSQSSF
ncbi:hypothetical protein BJ138DRAFT_1165865 [Hygrophoropsis aurantiaca]|uniref:Uncharacterized protein n=1 Tax=Hygrophoropsis aurantiaca TaxID=72124 RepID=A0ACB7ZVW6_9AGAM|nr:hypothetical protein BJ138DRAFT_1165865 [Hygrophoropsis aurantiaca]